MKRWLVIGLTLLSLSSIAGCNRDGHDTASWVFEGINWQHRIYRVTSQPVTSVGIEVTSVTNYSQNEGTPETGTFSNTFPVGTKIFSIPGINVSKAIAIEASKKRFVKAVLDHVY